MIYCQFMKTSDATETGRTDFVGTRRLTIRIPGLFYIRKTESQDVDFSYRAE